MNTSRAILLGALAFLTSFGAPLAVAGDRAADWDKVREAVDNKQARTALTLLKPLETAAFADQAWGEGTKALLMRVRIQCGLGFPEPVFADDKAVDSPPESGSDPSSDSDPFGDHSEDGEHIGDEEGGSSGLPGCVRLLEEEIPEAPAPVKPVLRWFQALWLLAYAEQEFYAIFQRDEIPQQNENRIEFWSPARIEAAIGNHFRQALDDPALRTTPVAAFREILGPPGAYGDAIRPTLYDLVAHSLARFLTDGPFLSPWSRPPSGIAASSPVFGSAAEFLAWELPAPGGTGPESGALAVYQQLLALHRDAPDRTAFLHCDLERLRWAGRFAGGKDKHARHLAAMRAFISDNAGHPLAAEARQDEALLLLMTGRTVEAHATAKAGANAFPDHPAGKLCQGIIRGMAERQFDLDTPGAWPTTGDEIIVSQKNFGRFWFRFYAHEWEVDPWKPNDNPSRLLKEWLQSLLDGVPTHAWNTGPDFPQDYRVHELTVPTPTDIAPGSYFLVVADHEKFAMQNIVTWVPLQVSNLRMPDLELVVDAVTGAPRPDVLVEIWQKPDHEDGTRQTTRTDAEGRFTFERLSMPGNGKIRITATAGGDRLIRERRVDSRAPEPAEPRVKEQVTFFTDRAIYRPGQTIQFKGLLSAADAEKGDYHAIADRNLTVTLTGPKDREIARQDFRTNAMGSFAGTFAAPTESLLGECTLRVDQLGRESIRVEEYKRPKFQIEIGAPTGPVEPGGEVTLRGTATAYTGAPIDGATVAWEVTREAWFKGLGEWLGWNDTTLEPATVAIGRTTTAPDGTFVITFAAEPDAWLDADKDPCFGFHIAADVTAPTGETQDASRYVCAAYSEFYAWIGLNDWQETGKPVLARISTATHDDEPFPAVGVLRVRALKQPPSCARDERHSYWDEPFSTAPRPGPEGWEPGAVIREIPVTTKRDDDGECLAEVPMDLPAGCHRLEFEARDTKGRKVSAFANVQVIDRAATRFPTKIPFFVETSARAVPPGQPLSVAWGSGHEVANALVEWYRDDELLHREWSAPGRTQQIFTLMANPSMRGGVTARVRQFSQNRARDRAAGFEVPWSDKSLHVKWERLSSKLAPGAKDTWTAVISGPDGKPAAAEMVATLYDASLDGLSRHEFASIERIFRTRGWSRHWPEGWSDSEFARAYSYYDWRREPTDDSGEVVIPFREPLPGLNEGLSIRSIISNSCERSVLLKGPHGRDGITLLHAEMFDIYSPPELPNSVGTGPFGGGFLGFPVTPATPGSSSGHMDRDDARAEALRRELARVGGRKKLDETAFFFPQLAAGADGRIRMAFTMPEGLGRWRFLGFAHDRELRSGHLEGATVTAKDLMVQPDPPRFLREGDTLDFTVRIANQSDREQSGLAALTLADASGATDRTAALGITEPEQPFAIPAKQSRTLAWRLTVPDGCGPLRYQARAACGGLTDGEEGWLPVLPRLVPVTDSMAITVRDAGETKRQFAALAASGGSDTLRHESLQVRVVSRPAWQALMALPYLMEFPHECAEQIFSRLYANALGHRIVSSDPEIRRAFDAWRAGPALESPLLKNRETAGLMLEETPWLLAAGDDTARRQRVALLFDDNRMAAEMATALATLKGMQHPGGMWPWFPGGRASEFITSHIVAGFGELRAAGVEVDLGPALDAAEALDSCLTTRHRRILAMEKTKPGTLEENHLDPVAAHILYSRSFFLKDRPPGGELADAHRYFLGQATRHWNKTGSRLTAAQLALALWRNGEPDTARRITRAFRETAVNHAESGMSWPVPPGSAWWWDAPVESHALMIAAFAEIDGDHQAVDDCRAWLIHQNRDGAWPTTTATTAAVHALRADPAGHRPEPRELPVVRVALGGAPLEPGAVEPGTGYYECGIPGAAVSPDMAAITLSKPGPGVAWVSLHWRYFEDAAKLKAHHSGGLKIKKHLLVRRSTPSGPREEPLAGPLRPGDGLITRLVVTSDRELEFVHLKDDRGSGTEPSNVLSGYRWQHGVGYYEATRDSATHFFIDRLPKGVHVLEHSSRVRHAGSYQTGAATVRCMYAPDFQARSASIRLEVSR